VIDDLPAGPIDYSVERLHQFKGSHEQWVMSLDSFDAGTQLADEQWAALIDNLGERMSWDTWTEDMSFLFSYVQFMTQVTYDRLKEAHTWLVGRVWPPGHSYLRATIEAMSGVLEDLILIFENHMVEEGHEPILKIKKFYKIEYWSPEDYEKLVVQWEFHCALIEDLCFELTRYGNLIANVIRTEIDASYRFDQGVLLVRFGIDIIWRDSTLRPEFSPEDIANEKQPYGDLQSFLKVRPSRKLSEATVGSPRTGSRPDPTRFPEGY
jgi:hypothetical protein